jgi:hypothetical protein
MNPIRKSLLFLALVLCSLTATAQTPPAFLIERIDIRGVRFASESVIERESLLVEGRTYSEKDLEHAIARINRLPFVLDSSFALEKGSERGAYVLVVQVVETKPLFVVADSTFRYDEDNLVGSTQNEEYLRSGVRLFLGSSSLVHASTDFDDNYEIGLTQYNLFGRAGWVAVNLRWTENDGRVSIDRPDGGVDELDIDVDPSPQILAGVPLFGDHSLAFRWERQSSTTTFLTSSEPDNEMDQSFDAGELAWVYNTTDDPILPTVGTEWRTGARVSWSSQDAVAGTGMTRFESRAETLFTSLNRYQALNDYVSLIYGVSGGTMRFVSDSSFGEFTTDRWGVAPMLGATTSLWSDRLTRKLGDLRFETRAHYFISEDDADPRYLDVTSSVVQRNVWGTLRLSFIYTDAENR